MIKKTLATVIMFSSLALSSTVMAAGLHDDMKVALINDGPVTIIIDTKNKE
jgi:D-Tyr-tRNAtyr deacylase